MWIYDRKTYRFLEVNDAALRSYGYSREEFRSMDLFSIRPAEDAARLREALDAARPPLQSLGTWRHRVKDGSLIDVEITSHTMKYQRRNAVLVTALDISRRKETEEGLAIALERERRTRQELEQVNRRLSLLLDASTLLVASPDFGNTLRKLAQVAVPVLADWCAIDAVDESGALNRLAVVHSDPAKVELAYEFARKYPSEPESSPVHRVLKSGKLEYYAEITDEMLVAATSSEEHLADARSLGFKSAVTTPFVSRNQPLGAITLVMAESDRRFTPDDVALVEELARRASMFIDYSLLLAETRRANAELEERVRERTRDLEALNKELVAFSYSVSHDLRAPLRHLSGFVQLLQSHVGAGLDEKARHYLDIIADAAKRMGQLIDDLLAFSRIGRADFHFGDVDVSGIVDQILQEHALDGRDSKVEWKVNQLPQVLGDASMLRLVFQNLIDNAVKFTRTRGQPVIEIGSETRVDKHVFHVRDNGVGFDMRYADKLFNVFQRLHSQDEFEGTGIGLANVRRIVERHRGEVWAEGALDRGATFFFSLPLERSRVSDG